METEQSTTDSVEAGISALQDKLFGSEPEAAQPEPVEEEAGDTHVEATAEQSPEDSGLVEIEAEGESFRVPPKLKDAFMRTQDYTAKTTELASLRKSVEDKAQFVEAREQIQRALQDDMGEYQRLEYQRKQYEELDWSSLYNADPGQAMKLRDQRDELARKMGEKSQLIQQKMAQGQQMLQQHADRQWTLAVEGVKKRIGNVSASDDAAMLDQVRALGFEGSEVKRVLADPRILHALFKAAKWDALQGTKGAALAKAQTAPPVIRPGSASPMKTAQADHMNFRKALKSSGSDKQKSMLIGDRIARKFGF